MKRSAASQLSSLLVLSLLSSTSRAVSISQPIDEELPKVLPSAFVENYREVRLGSTPLLEEVSEALKSGSGDDETSFVERIDNFPSDEIESKDDEHQEYTTTTIYVKLTATVTRHPVCMTTYEEQPPCLSDAHPSFRRYSLSVNKDGTSSVVTEPVDEEKIEDILRTHHIDASENELPSTEEGTMELESSVENAESRHIENPFARHPPFISSLPSFPHLPSLPSLPSLPTLSLPQLPAFSELPVVSAFYPHSSSADVQTVTATIIATSTSHVVNPHVTAILIAHNCMPENIDIPHCPRPTTHDLYKQHALHSQDHQYHLALHKNNHTVTPPPVTHAPVVYRPTIPPQYPSHHQFLRPPFFPPSFQSPYYHPYFPYNFYPFTSKPYHSVSQKRPESPSHSGYQQHSVPNHPPTPAVHYPTFSRYPYVSGQPTPVHEP